MQAQAQGRLVFIYYRGTWLLSVQQVGVMQKATISNLPHTSDELLA